MFELDLSKLEDYTKNKKNKKNKIKLNFSNNLLKFLQEQHWELTILQAALIRAYFINQYIEKEVKKLNLQDKFSWHLGKFYYPSIVDISFTNKKIENFIKFPNYIQLLAGGVPAKLPDKTWYNSQKLHMIIYNLFQQTLEYEKKLSNKINRSHCLLSF